MPDLEISPKNVSLGAGQTQVFEAFLEGKPVRDAQWSTQPSAGAGEIDAATGAYTSPKRIFRNRKVVVVAKAGGAPATAVVDLIPLSFWTRFLGFYLLFSFLLLLGILLGKWKSLCPQCDPEELRVSPPLVTLTASQSQVFTVDAKQVAWSPTLGVSGLFTAPPTIAADQKVALTATTDETPSRTAGAEVLLSPDIGLSLHPANATLREGGSLDLTPVFHRAPNRDPQAPTLPPQDLQVEWMAPAVGTITPGGSPSQTARFTAKGAVLDRPTTVLVLVRTRAAVPRVAGAWVTILPASAAETCDGDCSEEVAGLILLLGITGALGGLIHGISSFTTYVGNREFLTSWVWWYVFKPFLAALVAIVVFLVFRAGFGTGDYDLAAADCLKAAAFAGLIGLFAEPATLKLKDIFETLFTPRQDPRRDPAGKVKRQGPTLVSLEPSVLTQEQSVQTLTLNGTGFLPECQVKIGSTDLRKPSSVTSTRLEVRLEPSDVAKAQALSVIAYNKPPDGDPSNALELKVNPKP